MATVKTVQGLALSSMKARNGLAAASVKTINGLDSAAGPFGGLVSTTNLMEWWPLNEAADTNALGSFASKTLTDNNGVGATTGPDGSGARQFISTSGEFFNRTSEAALQMGDIEFSCTAWFYLDTLGAIGIMCKDTAAAGGREWTLYVTGAHNPRFIAFDGTNVVGSIIHSTVVTTGTWYHVVAYHSAALNQVGMSINAAAFETAATTGAPATTSTEFRLGNDARTTGNALWNGRIQRAGIWKRLLTGTDATNLYNSGNGLSY